LVVTAVACVVLAPSAWASGEIAHPCGPGAVYPSGFIPAYPESPLPWLNVCGADVSGVSGAGSLRAVRTVLHLYGDVASGAKTGAQYDASFNTQHCSVRSEYQIDPGPTLETGTMLEVYCDYRTEPCPSPESDVPNYSCGQDDQLWLTDSPAAVSGEVSGRSVTITFDPNELAAGSVPPGLVHDLSPVSYAGTPPVSHYGSLTDVWVQAMLHQGVRGIMSDTIGPGGDYAAGTRPVPLD
jgi:hypothetical protein